MSHAARARYIAAHWGLVGPDRDRKLWCADPREPLTVLGELVAVVYRTEKRGDGPSEYTHKFQRERPVLAFTHFGKHSLVIAGGDYVMRPEGIVR